jgi:predicted anti-sigma-YlaC factor YlaD
VNCVRAIDLMGAALEDAVPEVARAEFDDHLERCPRCHSYLDQLAATVRTLGRLPRPDTPNPRRAELLEHFRRGPRRRH